VTRRLFPPERRDATLAKVTAQITARRHLNPRRRHRSYPRVVKRARHNHYRVKTPTDIGTRHDAPPTIRIAKVSARAAA
jgi:hypothetical protein